MKFLLIAASHRPDSYNRRLIQLAAQHFSAKNISVESPEYQSLDLPPYNDCDREKGKIPASAQAVRDKVAGSDGLVISMPEYNWSYPGSLKNIIDWLSHFRPQPFLGKTAYLMCATPSKRGGAVGLSHLKIPLEALGCYVYPEVFTLSEAQAAFDEKGNINIPKANEQFYQLLDGFVDFSKKLNA